jgi:hypothetical protein
MGLSSQIGGPARGYQELYRVAPRETADLIKQGESSALPNLDHLSWAGTSWTTSLDG